MKFAAEADNSTGIDLGSIRLKFNVNTALGAAPGNRKRWVLNAVMDRPVVLLISEGNTPNRGY